MKKKTTMKKYAIKTPIGFVHGFDKRNQLVAIAGSWEQIKLFPTSERAEQFISEFADAGFGFERQGSVIVAA